MNSIRNTISILATAASMAFTVPTAANATPMQVIKKRPDLNQYCQRYYGAEARLTAYSALKWQCKKGPYQTWGISVSRACKDQYGLPKAAYELKSDPYSWYCYKPKPEPKRPNLTKYCRKHFGNSARAKLVGGTALDWVCSQGQHNRWGISVNQACKEQFGLPKSAYTNRNDPHSWYCTR